MSERLEKMLIRHEGYSKKLYRCTANKLTIGVGWNIEDRGLPDHIIDSLLDYAIAEANKEALLFRWFEHLNEARKAVIIDMLFNLGLTRFRKFKNMIGHLDLGQYELAAKEMLNSKWRDDVGDRAKELAYMMEKGIWRE